MTVAPGYASATPHVLAFSSDGQTMYGVVKASGDLLVYDLNSNNAPTVHALGLIDPVTIVVTPDVTKAYVAREAAGIDVIDLGTMTVITTIPTTAELIALSPDGASLYVAGSLFLDRYSTEDDTYVDGVATLITTPTGLAVSPNGLRAVVSGDASPGRLRSSTFRIWSWRRRSRPA